MYSSIFSHRYKVNYIHVCVFVCVAKHQTLVHSGKSRLGAMGLQLPLDLQLFALNLRRITGGGGGETENSDLLLESCFWYHGILRKDPRLL